MALMLRERGGGGGELTAKRSEMLDKGRALRLNPICLRIWNPTEGLDV